MSTIYKNLLIDSIEIMVESGRICCTDGDATGQDTCILAYEKQTSPNLFELAPKEFDLSKNDKVKKLLERFETTSNSAETYVYVMNFQHHLNAWGPGRIRSELSEILAEIDDKEGFNVTIGFHGHTREFHSDHRVAPIEVQPHPRSIIVRPKHFIRWSSYVMSHQIRLLDLYRPGLGRS